jgi:two-component sensor histidine kinase
MISGWTPQFTLRLRAGPEAPRAARHSLASLETHLESETYEKVQLLITELVTNSLRHGDLPRDARITVSVMIEHQGVRVEVSDPGDGFEADRALVRERTTRDRGWGLHLTDSLARRWGVIRGTRTTVWFELDRPVGAVV